MPEFNYGDATEYGFEPDLLEEILPKQIECSSSGAEDRLGRRRADDLSLEGRELLG